MAYLKKGKRYKVSEKRTRRNKRSRKKNTKVKITVLGISIFIISLVWIINRNENKDTRKESKIEETQRQEIERQDENKIAIEIKPETVETQGEVVEKIIEVTTEEAVETFITEIREENGLNEKNFGFFYYNTELNQSYFYNQDTYFTAASTVKVPVAMLYYDQINTGERKKEDTIIYQESSYEPGNGKTAATYKIKQEVPIQFLLKQAIINSDNTAVNILIDGIQNQNYRYEIAKYAKQELPADFYQSNITSVNYAYDILTQIEQNEETYEELIEYMKQSSGGGYLKKNIENYEVAHKYGSYNGYVHDYGIVYGPTTYKIGVFTKNVSNAEELIAQINQKIIKLLEV